MSNRKNNRGAKGKAGRKSRAELGLEEKKVTTVSVLPTLMKAAQDKHGTLSNAVTFAGKVFLSDELINEAVSKYGSVEAAVQFAVNPNYSNE